MSIFQNWLQQNDQFQMSPGTAFGQSGFESSKGFGFMDGNKSNNLEEPMRTLFGSNHSTFLNTSQVNVDFQTQSQMEPEMMEDNVTMSTWSPEPEVMMDRDVAKDNPSLDRLVPGFCSSQGSDTSSQGSIEEGLSLHSQLALKQTKAAFAEDKGAKKVKIIASNKERTFFNLSYCPQILPTLTQDSAYGSAQERSQTSTPTPSFGPVKPKFPIFPSNKRTYEMV